MCRFVDSLSRRGCGALAVRTYRPTNIDRVSARALVHGTRNDAEHKSFSERNKGFRDGSEEGHTPRTDDFIGERFFGIVKYPPSGDRRLFGVGTIDAAPLASDSNVLSSPLIARTFMAQVMRAAGVSPTFRHLRAICTYPDVRFAPWVAKLAGSSRSATSSSSSGPATTATVPNAKAAPSLDFDGGTVVASTAVTATQGLALRRGRRLRGEPPRPSVRTNSLAELGLSYTVSPRRRGAVAASSAAEEEREAFAPGRAGGKAVVRRVSHGLEVLDLYCGTGGFAMNAAVGKARSALGVRHTRGEGGI